MGEAGKKTKCDKGVSKTLKWPNHCPNVIPNRYNGKVLLKVRFGDFEPDTCGVVNEMKSKLLLSVSKERP